MKYCISGCVLVNQWQCDSAQPMEHETKRSRIYYIIVWAEQKNYMKMQPVCYWIESYWMKVAPEMEKSGNLAINVNLKNNKGVSDECSRLISVMEFFILKRRTSSECSSSSKMRKRKIPIQMRKEQSFLSNNLWAIWMPPFAAFDLLLSLSLFLPFSSA